MIRVEIYLDSEGQNIVGFIVKGHAGFAPHGQDIVCSAVSVLTQTTVLGLAQFAGIKVDYHVNKGDLKCFLPHELSETQNIQGQAILRTMYIGLDNIKDNYSDFIRIVEKRGGVTDV